MFMYIATKIYLPGERIWCKENKQSRQIPSNLCTYCMHLAGFFKDDMSPWVLSSIHIQRSNLKYKFPWLNPFLVLEIQNSAQCWMITKNVRLTIAKLPKSKCCKTVEDKKYCQNYVTCFCNLNCVLKFIVFTVILLNREVLKLYVKQK